MVKNNLLNLRDLRDKIIRVNPWSKIIRVNPCLSVVKNNLLNLRDLRDKIIRVNPCQSVVENYPCQSVSIRGQKQSAESARSA